MKLKFQADLDYQQQAIAAVTGLFEGQPMAAASLDLHGGFGGEMTELGYGNRLVLTPEALLANLRQVQERNGVLPGAAPDQLQTTPRVSGGDDWRAGIPHFSVEMETGTGKTYVYLRTIFELNRAYGWTKFIIVVPGVAIREGVMSTIRLTADHFRALYDHTPCDAWVYDSKQVSRLRQFATSNAIQVLVINIDAFNKKANNVIHAEQDRLSGRKPIEFIRATCPVVIVDEPQNMESENAQRAIAELDPLCTLRYSATHRNAYDRVYRLGPVEAYDMRLVKRIEVDSVVEDADFNRPYIEVESIEPTKSGPVAKLRIDVKGKGGLQRKSVTVKKNGFDLYVASGEREVYRGYIVSEINGRHGFVAFGNGQRVHAGESSGAHADDVMRVQIRRTIQEHFEKELAIAGRAPERRMKVLSLFFIDRVANYADADGKIRRWFEEEYVRIAAEPAYAALKPLPVGQVHDGYFARDAKGGAKDTSGATAADDAAYELIMKDKERLLSPEEPLRFIFSHSALREGWDNPNVFQICTLNDSKSEMRKRQEIGRGLRLPVMVDGERCRDEQVNTLTVIANESYDEFARQLQTEIEQETGQDFGGRVEKKRDRRKVKVDPLHPEFAALWDRIKFRTRYAVEFDTDRLVEHCVVKIRQMPEIEAPQIVVRRAELRLTDDGIEAPLVIAPEAVDVERGPDPLPDLLSYLQRETQLTRTTLARILVGSRRLADVRTNPQQFLDRVVDLIHRELTALMIDGIRYERLEGDDAEYSVREFKDQDTYEQRLVDVKKSIYDAIVFDSEVEREFALALDRRKDVRLFVKLPPWFKVPTPVGDYNPDWAIALERDEVVYLVRETKSTHDMAELRPDEASKIVCGDRHFRVLHVDYKVATSADEVK